MKSLIATGLVLSAGIVGSLAPATSAYAQRPIMHAGQICHAVRGSETGRFDYDSAGITNWGPYSGDVICPLVIKKDVSRGLRVDVSVKFSGEADRGPYSIGSTVCSLASVDYTGDVLGSTTRQIVPPERFVQFKLNGNQTRLYAHYSVACTLPTSQTLTNIIVYD